MENILDAYNKSNKTSLKHRRSHSVGFPVKVDPVFWNQVRANIKIDLHISRSEVKKKKYMLPNSSKFVSLYSPQKPRLIRRKSMDSKECNQKIMVPIMHTFKRFINYEEGRNLKIKLNALKALQESDELRLDKFISENKDLKNKLMNLNYVITLFENKLEKIIETNYHLSNLNNNILNKYDTMKILYEDNIKKVEKIKSINDLLSKIESCELDIFKVREDISLLKNDHTMAKIEYSRILCNTQEVNSLLLRQTTLLEDHSRVGTKYLNYLKNDLLYGEQNEYLLQNTNLKLRRSELLNEFNKTKNTFCNKKKVTVVIFKIFAYIMLC